MICANIQHPQRITPTVFGQMSHGIQAKRPFSTSPCRRMDKRKASPSRRSFSQQESHLGTLTSFKQSFPFTYYSCRLYSTCQWTRRQFNGSRATATEAANVHLLLYEGSPHVCPQGASVIPVRQSDGRKSPGSTGPSTPHKVLLP